MHKFSSLALNAPLKAPVRNNFAPWSAQRGPRTRISLELAFGGHALSRVWHIGRAVRPRSATYMRHAHFWLKQRAPGCPGPCWCWRPGSSGSLSRALNVLRQREVAQPSGRVPRTARLGKVLLDGLRDLPTRQGALSRNATAPSTFQGPVLFLLPQKVAGVLLAPAPILLGPVARHLSRVPSVVFVKRVLALLLIWLADTCCVWCFLAIKRVFIVKTPS